MCIDPFRDRVVFYGNPGIGAQLMRLHTLDASGAAVDLGYEGDKLMVLTPGASGKIYFHDESASGTIAPLRYLDAANVRHDVLDAAGTAPYSSPSFGRLTAMGYDPNSHALLVAIPSNTGVILCAGGSDTHVTLLRLELSPDGTRVLSQSCAQVAPDPFGANLPVGLCRMPDGDFLLTVDTNSNSNQPRMVRVNPLTLSTSAFASNGFYVGAAAVDAGCYSSLLGEALLLDNFNSRLWRFAELGGGNVLATSMPLSFGGSAGFNATMHEVPTAGCAGSVAYYCTAKLTSGGCLPVLSTSGTPSASAGSGFMVKAAQIQAGKAGIIFYSTNGAAAVPFQGGLLCVKAPVKRTPGQHSGGTPPCGGLFSFDFNAFLSAGSNPALVAGAVVHAQYWFRDPAHPVNGSGLTAGVTFTFCP
jgi:hypothetical protein